MRKRLIGTIGIGAALLIAAKSNAATITYNDSFGPDSIPFSSAPLASLPQFDPSLGTLDSFSLELVANTDSGEITYTDTSGNVSTDVELLGVGATVTATAPSAVTLVAVPLQTGSDPNLPAYGSYTVTGGSGTDSDTYGPDSNPAHFGPYEGVGTFNVDVGAVLAQSLITSGGSGTLTPTDGETNGTVYVTYNYTPVPEPASLGLLAAALPILVARRRRKV